MCTPVLYCYNNTRIIHYYKCKSHLQTYDELYVRLRKISTASLHSYGPGIARIERILQDVLQDFIEDINAKEGEVIDVDKLVTSFVCCVMVSMVSVYCSTARLINCYLLRTYKFRLRSLTQQISIQRETRRSRGITPNSQS